MSVQLIAGRAGTGKTHGCLSAISHDLELSLIEGPRLIFLVPEQAALQMERSLLAASKSRTLGRCEVLSFRRLAHRILSGLTAPTPVPLKPLGREMALRYLIGKHRKELQEFARISDRGGFISALSRGIAELLQESVTLEQLEAAASRAAADQDPSAPRLNDLSLLYRAYLDYLGSARVDPESVLDLARDRLGQTDWLVGANVWIDGFAGFTQQQLCMIVALAQRAEHIRLTLLMEPRASQPPDLLSLFARTEETWGQIARSLREANVSIDSPVLLNPGTAPRFSAAEVLAQLERNLFASGKSPDSSNLTGTVKLVAAPDHRTEVAACITAVLDLVQSSSDRLRYRDIAIVVRDLEPYHDLLSAALRQHGIPFFIDRRRPIFHHPLVQLIRASLLMHSEVPFSQAASLLFKTGLSGLSDEQADALENYALAHGLIAADSWAKPWIFPPPAYADQKNPSISAKRELEWLNNHRARFNELLADWLPAAGSKTAPCKFWNERLFELLVHLGVPNRLQSWSAEASRMKELDEALEHEQVWTDVISLLDELAAALGNESMTIRQFRDCLESGLSEMTLGLVPATLDQLLISSIERSRHPPVRAVFVLGFSEGQFPASIAEDAILGDEERERLELDGVCLSRTRVGRILDERLLAYIAFTRASEFLWVSYPRTDPRGRPVQPSSLWPMLEAALPGARTENLIEDGPEAIASISGLTIRLANWARLRPAQRPAGVQDSEWIALYEWARKQTTIQSYLKSAFTSLKPDRTASLSPASAAALWPPPHPTSATALEDFAWCPYQHFVKRGLKLTERARSAVLPVDMGRLYHGILQQFVNEMIEKDQTLADLSPEKIAENLERLCRLEVPRYAEKVHLLESQQRRAGWRGRRDLPPALYGQKSSIGLTKLRPLMTEQPFGFEELGSLPALELDLGDGRTVLLRGKIDRLDIVPSDHGTIGIVFDYKRSLGRKLQLAEVYHGLALQLLAYLLVIRKHGKTGEGARILPGGACYLPLLADLNRVDDPDESTDASKAYKPRGVVDFDALTHIESSIENGWNKSFTIYRTKEGGIGNLDSTDSVSSEQLPMILDHVENEMIDLARRWLDGDIAAKPTRLGKRLPCTYCAFRGACRFEHVLRETRSFSALSRTEVLDLLGKARNG